jgi:hypothetical protein
LLEKGSNALGLLASSFSFLSPSRGANQPRVGGVLGKLARR